MGNLKMAALILGFIVLMIVVLCAIEYRRAEDTDDTPQEYAVDKQYSLNPFKPGFQYVKVDGHEYLVYSGVRRFGITHSPKCPCLPCLRVRVEDKGEHWEDNWHKEEDSKCN